MKLINSFFFMKNSVHKLEVMAEIALCIEDLRNYFAHYNIGCADEAMQAAFVHAYRKYDESQELRPYIKSLAKTILKTNVMDIDQSDYIEEIAIAREDTADEAILSTHRKDTTRYVIKEIMLPFMSNFLALGDLLRQQDLSAGVIAELSTKYINKVFKEHCVKAINKFSAVEFIDTINYLYETYYDELTWFLEQDKFAVSNYIESNYQILEKAKSVRVFLCDESGNEIDTPDTYEGKLYTSSKKKMYYYRVNYLDLLYQMEYLTESPIINELVFVASKYRIIRTCGGSISLVNADNCSDLLKDELITNIVRYTQMRILSTGFEYVYLLSTKEIDYDKIIFKGVIGFDRITLDIEKVEVEQLN